jgi:anti-sigma factor RsiW
MPDSKATNISSNPTCEEIFAVLSEYIDGELPEELCEAIQAHNGNCPPCQAFVETFTKTIELVRKQPAEPLPSAVKDELSAALKRCQDALEQAR